MMSKQLSANNTELQSDLVDPFRVVQNIPNQPNIAHTACGQKKSEFVTDSAECLAEMTFGT